MLYMYNTQKFTKLCLESAIGDDIDSKDEELNTEAVMERTESQDHDKKASHVHVMFEDQLKHQEESEEMTESHPTGTCANMYVLEYT